MEKGNQLLTRIRGAARVSGLSTGPLYVWFLLLFDAEGRETHQLNPVQQIFLDMYSTSEERRLAASRASSNAESNKQIANALEILGEENDWASIRKTIEAMSATPDGKRRNPAALADQIDYDKAKIKRLFRDASDGVHGYGHPYVNAASEQSLRSAETELRSIVEKWLTLKTGNSRVIDEAND